MPANCNACHTYTLLCTLLNKPIVTCLRTRDIMWCNYCCIFTDLHARNTHTHTHSSTYHSVSSNQTNANNINNINGNNSKKHNWQSRKAERVAAYKPKQRKTETINMKKKISQSHKDKKHHSCGYNNAMQYQQLQRCIIFKHIVDATWKTTLSLTRRTATIHSSLHLSTIPSTTQY